MSCAVFKLSRVCYALKRKTNGSPQPLAYFLPYGKEQEVHKCIHPKHFRVSGIKISTVVTKETSQIFSLFMWRNHIPKLNITFPSKVLVLSNIRPYRNLTFHNVLVRQVLLYIVIELFCVAWHEIGGPRRLSRRSKDELLNSACTRRNISFNLPEL